MPIPDIVVDNPTVDAQWWIKAAQGSIRRYCGWHVTPEIDDTLKVDAYGGSILSAVLGIYYTWFIGTALEREWGDFRYTVYLLSGVLGTVLGCLLTGVTASTYCLSLSLLLAFAMLYPEVQLLLFFVIPIRVKYFGVFAAVLWVFSFLGASLPGKLDYLLSMLNVWLFFAPMAYRSLRAWVRREQWKRKNRR